MKRPLKNTLAVLVATGLTAAAIFAGVSLASVAVGGTTASTATASAGYYTTVSNVSQSSSGTLVCPRTGCTASTCHAVTGLPPGQ